MQFLHRVQGFGHWQELDAAKAIREKEQKEVSTAGFRVER